MQDVKRHKKACHLSTLVFFFFAGSGCAGFDPPFQHITALILQLSHRPLTVSQQLPWPPLLRLFICSLQTDMYKQTETKSKTVNDPDSLRRLRICNLSCALFAERLGGSNFCLPGRVCLGSIWLRCRFREVDQVQLSIGMDQNVIR